MNKQNKSASLHRAERVKPKTAPGIPLIVFYWAFCLGLLGYLISRIVFTYHPYHWISGAIGLLLGVVIGYVWFYKRGDVGLI